MMNFFSQITLGIHWKWISQNIKILVVAAVKHALIFVMDFLKTFKIEANFNDWLCQFIYAVLCVVNTLGSFSELSAVKKRKLQVIIDMFAFIATEGKLGGTHTSLIIDTSDSKPFA